MTLKGGTSQACAACKYQRKRCTPECALAPHFRPEQTEIFKNAHKLFGVKNILQTLKQIDPSQKTEAMRSIIYEANMRERFPVHGCLGIICELQHHIRQAEKELYAVLSQLEFYKQRRQQEITLSPMDSPESQQLQSSNQGLILFQNETTHDHHTNNQLYVPVNALPISSYPDCGNENVNNGNGYNFCNDSEIRIDSKGNMNMGNVMWCDQLTFVNENNGKGLMSSQSEVVNTPPLNIQEEVTHDYDEIYPFFDTIDDTHSYIDSKEANESSCESSFKETTQSIHHIAGNNLKNAELQLGLVSEDYGAFA
ncbi:LOB domain-containing protein 27 [Rutidosis leptorrhynchoides]|uniref:LOB domain-containing protein 27 n=1 Tax=Rutidosis leptorrhynchoides TaxID=125765 RepID=UPI003A9A42C8